MTEELNQSGVLLCSNIKEDIIKYIDVYESSQIFILTDENTLKHCAPVIYEVPVLKEAAMFTMKESDEHKNLETLAQIWEFLGERKATRHSLMINLGGGVVTDIGGFAASTYKRGMQFYNIPTTLLSIVDAAVGGKTGINFGGLKNQIGVIRQPKHVFIDPQFLATLDQANMVSGYAEMIKHALISSEADWKEITGFNILDIEIESLRPLLWKSIAIKEKVVAIDPNEMGLRKALNLGHTIGHAFESLSHEKHAPVLHGVAVAGGLIPELYLSVKKTGFPQEILDEAVAMISNGYPTCDVTPDDFARCYELMTHDKKNVGNRINFTLLSGFGEVKIDQHCTKEEIYEAMEYYIKVVTA